MDRQYFEPLSLREALEVLHQHPDAGIIAGGTDLAVADRSGKRVLPTTLLAIHRLKELAGINPTADGGLRIGALTTHADLESRPEVQTRWHALADAAALVGSPATRHAGTIGGNVCNGSPAMEVGSPLLIFDANVELASTSGTRTIPFGRFVTGPGKTERRPNELLAAVILPPLPTQRSAGTAYIRLEYRRAMEIAITGAAAMLVLDGDGRCIEARIALTAVAPTCVRATESERLLNGQGISDDLLERAADAAAGVARPIDDVRGSADYRRAMVPVITRQALHAAVERRTRQGAATSVAV
jgi:aerobic carbon-monoxide dehydrogenase medium subunit